MPELPEVETVRRTLDTALRGQQIIGVASVNWPRTIASPSVEQFCAAVCNRRIRGVGRRGKFVLIYLDRDELLAVHLRMTGSLLVAQPGQPVDSYTRVVFALEGGVELRFRDVRKFGRIWLLGPDTFAKLDAELGTEPLEASFTLEHMAERLAARRGRLKPLLLDQRIIAGLGNIYADEALWRAGLHPLRAAGSLSREELEQLYSAIREVLWEAVARRGTTFSDYRDALGEMGTNQDYLAVYNRAGSACRRCSAAIERIVVSQRGTYLCPRCQPLDGVQ